MHAPPFTSVLSGLCATTMLVGLAGSAAASDVEPSRAGGTSSLDRFYQQEADWGGCQLGPDDDIGRELDEAGAECAQITVPLDYESPDGAAITVAVSRLAATSDDRLGALMINLGGPGGSDRDAPVFLQETMGSVGARFDLVGMELRGTGHSAPVDCEWPTGHWTRSPGSTRRSFDRAVELERQLAAQCWDRHAGLLPHISTANIARDMDVARAALGEDRTSYLGYSYGTLLGAVYAQLFPERLDRVVLDGPINPNSYLPGVEPEMAPPNEEGLDNWAAWVAGEHSTYGLGRSRQQVLHTMRTILKVSERTPFRVGGFTVDHHAMTVLLLDPLGDERKDRMLAEWAQTLHQASKGVQVTPPESLEMTLEFVTTGAISNYGSAQAAIMCGSGSVPSDPEIYWKRIQRVRGTLPFFGPTLSSISPCAFWPESPEAPPEVDTEAAALVVAAVNDPRTIYRNAAPLRDAMGPGSQIITLTDARIHGVYAEFGNACVDDAVAAYLDSGELPDDDLTCAHD